MGAGSWVGPTSRPCGLIRFQLLPPEPTAVGLQSLPPWALAVGWTAGDGSVYLGLTWISGLPPIPLAVACTSLPPYSLAVGKRVRSRNFFEPGSDPDFVCKNGQNTKFGRPRPGSPQHSRIMRRRRPLAPAAVGDLNDVDAARRPACTRKRQPRHAHRPRRRRPVTPAPARCLRRDGDLGCTDPLEARLAHSAHGGPRPRYRCSWLRRARCTRRPAVCVVRCRSPAHRCEGARRPDPTGRAPLRVAWQ